ncbi:antiterminator LoaP [Enterocloster clostridioformis]
MNWYAIFVKTGFEDDVCFYINKLEIQYYSNLDFKLLVPKRILYERREGIRNEVIKVLFPGYILLETNNINDFYHKTRCCPHIIRFLKDEISFQQVSASEISHILGLADNKGLINISQAIFIEDKIRIMEGPLLNREGIIKKIDKRKGRAKVEFSINQNTILIDLGIDVIQKVEI